MVYQFDPDMLPDTCFHAGELKYVVPGNECRLMDPRRTPLRVIEVKPASGLFVVEILEFEDKGGHWELPLESVGRCQFVQGSVEASDVEVALYVETIARLDRRLEIPANPSRRATSEATISSLRADVGTWLESQSTFLRSGASLDFSKRTGDAGLCDDLRRYMTEKGLWDVEQGFADHYVRSFHFGELVKGHRIVLAELGLVSFEGRQLRDPDLFSGVWNKQRRADHILYRLAFVSELFERLGHSTLVLYRGSSYRGKLQGRLNNGFVSATFSLALSSLPRERRRRSAAPVLAAMSRASARSQFLELRRDIRTAR